MSKQYVQIRNFSLHKRQDTDNPYAAPELFCNVVKGEVYNHPTQQDGKTIMTSQIVKVEGRIVHTRNSVYRLHGRPLKEFLKWMKDKGIPYNGEAPFDGLEEYYK